MKREMIPGMIVALVLRAPVSPLADARLPADMSRLGDAWTALEQIDAGSGVFGAHHALSGFIGSQGQPMRFGDSPLLFRTPTDMTLQRSER
ncbi:hypothetical protein [Caballeronia sp. Lep1P3]|uniref:hypothetical protein n=1 Tax=Caballeronia sp. Lep1P3 TaxID=2878150 RepID=UPI001FD5AC7E|nr:hypothetical protein [Caballeronia sp. Lep1P3]